MTDSKKPTEAEAEDVSQEVSPPDTADTAPDPIESDTKADQPDAAPQPELQEPEVVDGAEAAPEPAPQRRGGFIGMVLGGALAAGGGFVAAEYLGPLGLFGDKPDARYDALTLKNNELAQTIADLKSTLAAQKPVDVSPELAALGTADGKMAARIVTHTQDIQALEARVLTLEKQPLTQSDLRGAVDAYERELDEMRAALDNQRSQNDALMARMASAADSATAKIETATNNARALEARGALMRVMAAIEAGTPYGSALPALQDFTVPAALSAHAKTGVVSLKQLQQGFSDPARLALAASLRADPGEGMTERLGAFLRAQTGARSLTPRAGDDPDAILSRAEAALTRGALAEALTELSALPAAGQEAMASWTLQARSRIDALAAAETLASQVRLN